MKKLLILLTTMILLGSSSSSLFAFDFGSLLKTKIPENYIKLGESKQFKNMEIRYFKPPASTNVVNIFRVNEEKREILIKEKNPEAAGVETFLGIYLRHTEVNNEQYLIVDLPQDIAKFKADVLAYISPAQARAQREKEAARYLRHAPKNAKELQRSKLYAMDAPMGSVQQITNYLQTVAFSGAKGKWQEGKSGWVLKLNYKDEMTNKKGVIQILLKDYVEVGSVYVAKVAKNGRYLNNHQINELFYVGYSLACMQGKINCL